MRTSFSSCFRPSRSCGCVTSVRDTGGRNTNVVAPWSATKLIRTRPARTVGQCPSDERAIFYLSEARGQASDYAKCPFRQPVLPSTASSLQADSIHWPVSRALRVCAEESPRRPIDPAGRPGRVVRAGRSTRPHLECLQVADDVAALHRHASRRSSKHRHKIGPAVGLWQRRDTSVDLLSNGRDQVRFFDQTHSVVLCVFVVDGIRQPSCFTQPATSSKIILYDMNGSRM